MKIGIITKIGKNYGAVLQAYALKTKLCEFGAEAHIIKYTPSISEKSYEVIRSPWRLRGTIVNIKSLIRRKDIVQSSKRFLQFREEYYEFLGEYRTDEEIEHNPPKCDIYITGSDQVWNPTISFDRTFYCVFAQKKYPQATCAAYAASIGVKDIASNLKDEFCKRVGEFDYISVREKAAKQLLNEMGINASVAPDPTLLFTAEEWNKIAVEPLIKEQYILCYFVSFPKGIEKTVQAVKSKLGLKVVNLLLSEESASIGDMKIRDAGPKEFLGLFKNAAFVITSSFHGTVFSIINRKPFMTSLYKQTGSRVIELLENIDLAERIVEPGETHIDKYCNGTVYSSKTDIKLEQIRCAGELVLSEIMEGN